MITIKQAIEIVKEEIHCATFYGSKEQLQQVLECLKVADRLAQATDALNPQCLSLGAGTMQNLKFLTNQII